MMGAKRASPDPVTLVLDRAEETGFKVDRRTRRFQCPAHGGKDKNAVVNPGDDGRALLSCHSQKCTSEEIATALGLTMANLFPPDAGVQTSHEPHFSNFDYRDEAGRLVYQTVRRVPGFEGKDKSIWQRRPDGRGDWIKDLEGVTPLPYRLPELLESSGLVVIAEGEPCVEMLERLGFTATCNHGGAEQWRSELNRWFAGRDVAVIPDNDEAGLKHAHLVASSLHGVATSVRVLEPLPGVGPKGDVVNFVAAGGTADELRCLIDATPVWQPVEKGAVASNGHLGPPDSDAAGDDLDSLNSLFSLSAKPSELHPVALHGVAGEVVAAFTPFTEADPAAILASFLVAFGSACGSGPHAWVSETRHGLNLAAVTVGATSRSRKGTSWGPVARVFDRADAEWLNERMVSGIGSGEGIIWAIRDPSEPKEDPKTGQTIIEDQGVRDKRLLVHEPEFSSVLKVAGRHGSILSEIIRKAWDAETLANTVKRSPVKATGPHVSFLGHITEEELRRELSETAQVNGLANRFLWLYVRRSKLLPDAPRLDETAAAALGAQVRRALEHARKCAEVRRDADAAELWRQVYPQLSKDHPGLFGALTARAEAHVLRLSMIYALLDGEASVRVAHLQAALGFWNYCEDSARFIFGDRTGDPVADRIRDALRSCESMTETDISGLFSRHQQSGRVQAALGLLLADGMATVEAENTAGRPRRIWRTTR